MIDFSWIFILYEFLQEAFGWLHPMEYTPRDLMIFGIVVAVLWGLALVIPKPKNSSKISVKRLFRILAGLGLVGLGIMSLVVYRQPIASWGQQVFGVSKDTFWIIAISALLFLVGLGAFIIRLFLSKKPNNESGLNGRQKLGALCALAWVLLVGYLSWMLVYPAFRGAMSAIILLTEILSVVFWFYDPLIYIFSRLFTIPIKPACEPTPGKLNRFAVLGCAHNEEKVIDKLVESLYATSYPRDKYDVFVICDNCTDNTAQKVREAGGIPMERNDAEKRGKGFALEWMFDILTQKRPAKQSQVFF